MRIIESQWLSMGRRFTKVLNTLIPQINGMVFNHLTYGKENYDLVFLFLKSMYTYSLYFFYYCFHLLTIIYIYIYITNYFLNCQKTTWFFKILLESK